MTVFRDTVIKSRPTDMIWWEHNTLEIKQQQRYYLIAHIISLLERNGYYIMYTR